MVRLSWLSFLGQFIKHLYVALIFGIDLAQPHRGMEGGAVDGITVAISGHKGFTLTGASIQDQTMDGTSLTVYM